MHAAIDDGFAASGTGKRVSPVEASWEHTPRPLQSRIADLVAREAPQRRERSRRAVLAAAVIVFGAAGGAALFQRVLRSAPDPVSTALAEFRQALVLPAPHR